MQQFKDRLVIFCEQKIQERANRLKEELSGLKSSMENETKSSVGDKHETARARMQAEEENIAKQLREAEDQLLALSKSEKKLIVTSSELFLIFTALGKLNFEGKALYVISPQSPLGKVLKNAKEGELLHFNSRNYQILHVF